MPGGVIVTKVKAAAWVENFKPVYSKSDNFEAQDILNEKYFYKIVIVIARATPGEQVT